MARVDKHPPRSAADRLDVTTGASQSEAKHGGLHASRTPSGNVNHDHQATPPLHTRAARAQNVCTDIDFPHIREICEKDSLPCDVDLSPPIFAQYRREHWPDPDLGSKHSDLASIYSNVRSTGVPNALSARHILPTNLNLPAWEKYLLGVDDKLLDFVKYGFPMGYVGPISDTTYVPNHPSANEFPTQLDDFIRKELDLGGLVGPLVAPPFVQWAHVSPLMSRPKADPTQRRIITDLTYPRATSVNSYIRKNTVMGMTQTHCLPSVDAVVQRVQEIGKAAHIFTIDISRAYKNFKSCPLDWPLLAIAWGSSYYLDITMPFGSRASSGHMQRVADAIVEILRRRGVTAHMYLDDLIVVADGHAKASEQYTAVRALFKELGLPEAVEKSQPPSQSAKWLGVNIDVVEGTLAIPGEKLEDVLETIEKFIKKRSLTRRQLQSVLGKLLHVAKCVRPARLFVSRLLDRLRGAPRYYINVDAEIRADLRWFQQFAADWNGVSFMIHMTPTRDIVADACLTGIGAASNTMAYTYDVAYPDDPIHNISEIEAVNVAVAAQTLIGESDRGTCVRIFCDNLASVSVFQSGRGKNPVILHAARALWMVQAVYQVHIIFSHIPGSHNDLADTLSRASTSITMCNKAHELVQACGLIWTQPRLDVIDSVRSILLCRSGASAPSMEGPGQTDKGQSDRHEREQEVSSQRMVQVLPRHTHGSPTPTAVPTLHVPGNAERPGTGPLYDPEPPRPHPYLPQAHWDASCRQPSPCYVGNGRDHEKKGLRETRAPAGSNSSYYQGSRRSPINTKHPGREGGDSYDVLRRHETV